MSRTHKDAPGLRKARHARRFAARETPLDRALAEAAPCAADLWEAFADPARSNRTRQAAAIQLGLVDAADTDLGQALARAELTQIAAGW